MKEIYLKVMGYFRGISIDKYWHFIAGMIIASFFALSIDFGPCILPVAVAAFLKEAIDCLPAENDIDWWDIFATIIGGLIIQFFVLL